MFKSGADGQQRSATNQYERRGTGHDLWQWIASRQTPPAPFRPIRNSRQGSSPNGGDCPGRLQSEGPEPGPGIAGRCHWIIRKKRSGRELRDFGMDGPLPMVSIAKFLVRTDHSHRPPRGLTVKTDVGISRIQLVAQFLHAGGLSQAYLRVTKRFRMAALCPSIDEIARGRPISRGPSSTSSSGCDTPYFYTRGLYVSPLLSLEKLPPFARRSCGAGIRYIDLCWCQ